ncbi:dicarboxylate carrier protein [Salpingoeca rosetta]|uniref:Dicarboxylate carrier protein n=1 Tax=Salpingoeca rosetta (strain ATCC 50818 / BSB-021) TaxID=946362 RepID=F2UTI4_SALR5|nr:dicarboxylate carrier protein [Salpingoeca rosetta]EGD83706.1 dicarboxylate carrier protein [Salpingoeca rosetta]|eukprot:XP_004987519.1 dicarboxylate carrier protein [Salpingoeca rosetta]
MTAGGCGGIVGTPMDVCNVRMQNDGRLPAAERRNYKHVGNALVRIIREEGIGKLYSGLGPNVIRAMLMTAGQLASYDTFKQLLLTTTGGLFKDNLVTHFTASTLAGGVATLLTQPVDVVKTRVMAATPGTYSSALQCAGMTLKQEGPLAFFRGMVPAFTRLGPQTILTFVFLEQLRRLHYYLTHGDDKPV